jgi:hypothetical protein
VLAVTVLGSGIAALDATVVNIALPTIQAPTLGWSSLTVLAMAVAGALGLAAFLVWDHTAAWPMLPLGVFREWQFAATNVATFIMYAALTGATFLPPIQLQVVSGYLPLASGLPLLPLTLIMLALSARSGRLATRIGPRLQMSAGPVIVGAGLALLVFSNYGSSYVVCVLPAVVVFGLGRGHGRAPHRNRDELGAGGAFRYRVRGQQRRGPVGRMARSEHGRTQRVVQRTDRATGPPAGAPATRPCCV